MVDDTTEADSDDGNEAPNQSGTGVRTLLLVGVSFVAGYLFGKRQGSERDLHEELDEFGRSEEGPMEIEIQGTNDSVEVESESETEKADNDATDETETDEKTDETDE